MLAMTIKTAIVTTIASRHPHHSHRYHYTAAATIRTLLTVVNTITTTCAILSLEANALRVKCLPTLTGNARQSSRPARRSVQQHFQTVLIVATMIQRVASGV